MLQYQWVYTLHKLVIAKKLIRHWVFSWVKFTLLSVNTDFLRWEFIFLGINTLRWEFIFLGINATLSKQAWTEHAIHWKHPYWRWWMVNKYEISHTSGGFMFSTLVILPCIMRKCGLLILRETDLNKSATFWLLAAVPFIMYLFLPPTITWSQENNSTIKTLRTIQKKENHQQYC